MNISTLLEKLIIFTKEKFSVEPVIFALEKGLLTGNQVINAAISNNDLELFNLAKKVAGASISWPRTMFDNLPKLAPINYDNNGNLITQNANYELVTALFAEQHSIRRFDLDTLIKYGILAKDFKLLQTVNEIGNYNWVRYSFSDWGLEHELHNTFVDIAPKDWGFGPDFDARKTMKLLLANGVKANDRDLINFIDDRDVELLQEAIKYRNIEESNIIKHGLSTAADYNNQELLEFFMEQSKNLPKEQLEAIMNGLRWNNKFTKDEASEDKLNSEEDTLSFCENEYKDSESLNLLEKMNQELENVNQEPENTDYVA